MVWAAWVTAGAALVTAILNGAALIRHGRADSRRFAELHSRLNGDG